MTSVSSSLPSLASSSFLKNSKDDLLVDMIGNSSPVRGKLQKVRSMDSLKIVRNRYLPPSSLDSFIEDSYISVISKINSASSTCGRYAIRSSVVEPKKVASSARTLSASEQESALPFPESAAHLKDNCFTNVVSTSTSTLTSSSTSAFHREKTCNRQRFTLMGLVECIPPLTLGRVSVLLFLLAIVTDVALNDVSAQMHRLGSQPDYYELSTEVIRPAFYECDRSIPMPMAKASTKSSRGQHRAGLGDAAISSITEALSPILPFAGGLDLRRQEHWDKEANVFEKMFDFVKQVRVAFQKHQQPEYRHPIHDDRKSTLFRIFNRNSKRIGDDIITTTSSTIINQVPRSGGQVPSQLASHRTTNAKKFNNVIADAMPFVSLDTIAELTLGDVGTAFSYAVESSKQNFNEKKFLNSVLPRVKSVLMAVDSVASKSRGNGVNPTQTSHSSNGNNGDVDALKFCAAMRLFAEWRLLRQVPDGYKGYAVGMKLGHKDIVQNLAKIEEAAHSWINVRREELQLESNEPVKLSSPTLRDLLSYELETDVHPTSRLPVLKEKSAAMGLLWVRRQLDYQSALMVNILKVPNKYPSTGEAIEAAYSQIFNKYHGWAIQKIFTYSFQAAPDAEIIYAFMNPHRRKDVIKEFRGKTTQSPSDDANKSQKRWKGGLLGKLGVMPEPSQIEVSRGGSNEAGKDCSSASASARTRTTNEDTCSRSELESYILQEMTRDAHQQIQDYLSVVQPLQADLSGLIAEYNMDDPTKV